MPANFTAKDASIRTQQVRDEKAKGTWTSDGKSYPTKHGIVDLSLMETLATDSNGEQNKGEN